MCGAYGHIYENCFLLEKSEEIERAGTNVLPIEEIDVLPIEEIDLSDDDWADGCEAPL